MRENTCPSVSNPTAKCMLKDSSDSVSLLVYILFTLHPSILIFSVVRQSILLQTPDSTLIFDTVLELSWNLPKKMYRIR